MLRNDRIPMTSKEKTAVEALLAANEGASVSMTRTEPGEKGPIQVEIDGQVWIVSSSTVRKQD